MQLRYVLKELLNLVIALFILSFLLTCQMDTLMKVLVGLPKKAVDPDALMKAAFSISLSRKWLVRIRQQVCKKKKLRINSKKIRATDHIQESDTEKEVEFLPFVVSINKSDEYKKTVIVDDYVPAFDYYKYAAFFFLPAFFFS